MLEMANIIELDCFTFKEYKQIVDMYVEHDCREINFQNRVIVPLLERILVKEENVFIVDVHQQYRNRQSKVHTREQYVGEHTPDLLVVRNWYYNNMKVSPNDYIAIVEVKSPELDPINRDSEHTKKEIEEYLKIRDRVILTDCYIWKFYKKKENEIENKEFVLNDSNKWIEENENWKSFIWYLKEFLL